MILFGIETLPMCIRAYIVYFLRELSEVAVRMSGLVFNPLPDGDT